MVELDKRRAAAFAGRLVSAYADAMLTLLVDLGSRTGLLDAAAGGPGTSGEIAERAGLSERYVREWLAGMVTAGVVEYEPAGRTYTLPPEHAVCLTGATFYDTSPMAGMVAHAATMTERVAGAVRDGAGVGYDEQPDALFALLDRLGRARYETFLVPRYLPLVPGLVERLEAGARAVDVGCGSGHVANVMARAFPASQVLGVDTSEESLRRARAEAEAWGLGNVRFEPRDVAELPAAAFDLVTAFDVVHDLGRPREALASIRTALADGGAFLMYDVGAPSALEEQVGLPWAPFMYGVSVYGCLGFSLASDGEGVGAMWGRQTAEAMLAEAGFGDVAVHDVPGDPINAIYVCRP